MKIPILYNSSLYDIIWDLVCLSLIHVHTPHTQKYTYTYIHTQTHTHIHTHIHTHTYIYIYVCACVCLYNFVYLLPDPPVIASQYNNDTITSVRDGTVTLPCDVSGDPRPVVVWKKNGVVLSSSDPHYFVNDQDSLVIFSVDAGDSASYICEASNEVGRAQKNIQLVVQCEWIIPERWYEEINVIGLFGISIRFLNLVQDNLNHIFQLTKWHITSV